MKILALDTATEACSAALLIDGHLIAREAEFEREHAEHILSMVDAVLAEAGVSLSAIDALAFGRGPGAFTGVRLAASVAQGLAFAADRPVVPVSDLAALAQRAFDLEPATPRVLVCNDARMQEVYWACFERGPYVSGQEPGGAAMAGMQGAAGQPSEIGAGCALLIGLEHVGPPATVTLPPAWNVPPGANAGTVGAVGRGFRAYPELRSRLLSPAGTGSPAAHLISDDLLPRAHEIARLAVREVRAGHVRPPEEALPVYLRDDVARPPPSRN